MGKNGETAEVVPQEGEGATSIITANYKFYMNLSMRQETACPALREHKTTGSDRTCHSSGNILVTWIIWRSYPTFLFLSDFMAYCFAVFQEIIPV
ncbi:MAG: hypothetical protein GY845_30605 [Planctomycetes bacterium]|nr:hypothetical protein [Planctomycetota bacterium]